MTHYNTNTALKYAEKLFNSKLGINGKPFGATNSKNKGVSDGQEGVQWNISVNMESGETILGVNLEGKKYNNWPIANVYRE